MSTKSGKPYKVVENVTLGRYLVATRDIFPGESIIDELPLVTGPVSWNNFSTTTIDPDDPGHDLDILCLVCCTKYSSPNPCALCGIKLCSQACAQNEMHSQQECKVLQNLVKRLHETNSQLNIPSNKVLYNFILTIKCLYYYKTDKWGQISSLQSSVEELEKVGAFSDISHLFNLLTWGDFGIVPEQESANNLAHLAKHCLGAMIMNGFSLCNRQGLYFLSSLMAHSCIMNTDRRIQPGTGRMVTRAGRRIRVGEPITTTYMTTLEGTHVRWKELKKGWMFTCRCERCVNPEQEMGTNLSTIQCPKCGGLSLCPSVCSQGQGQGSDHLRWSCTNSGCGYEILQSYPGEKVESGESGPWNVLDLVESSKPKDLWNLEEVEEWLNKYCDTKAEEGTQRSIHRNHSVFIQVKLYLAQGYGRNLENGIGSLEDMRLRRKLDYCRDLLRVAEKLFEGIYEMKGVLFFEMWSSLVEIRQRKQSQENAGGRQEDHFKDVDICTSTISGSREKAVEILRYCFPNSPEASMLQVMQDHQLDNWSTQ